MPSWTVPSDSHSVGDTGHTTDHNHVADDLTLVNDAVPVVSGGLTGATAATRWAGATASGSPASGTFAVGDFVIDQTGKVWVCTSAGSPGTWANAGTGSGMSNPMTTSGDIIYGGSSGTPARLAAGTSGYYLKTLGSGSAPSWAAVSGGSSGYNAVLTPSGDATGAADAAAIMSAVAALPSTGGVIRGLPSANWNIECNQVVIARSGVYLDFTGCYINAVGAGNVFWMHDADLYTTTVVYGGGILGFPWIDGTNTTGNSCALHMGDIFRGVAEVQAANFTAGTTSKGFWFANWYTFTEQLRGEVYAQGCTVGVQFDYVPQTGYTAYATGSFARLHMDCYIDSEGLGDGVVVTNGVFIYDARLGIYGNFSYPPTGTTVHACLRITGGASATNTSIFDSQLWMGCELGGTANAYVPYTIYFADNLYNWINDCSGVLDFSAASAFTACNYPSQVYGFQGNFDGDAGISPLYFGGSSTLGAAVYSTPTFTTATAKQLNTVEDVMLYIAVKTSISVTLSIGPSSAASDSIVPVTTMPIGAFVAVRIPASWYVKLTCATMADLQLSQVTC